MIVDNGMEIPADGFLVKSSEITADESAMTGETLPIKKDTLENCVISRN
jgi:magnesium-transporting ATPase (P-type)